MKTLNDLAKLVGLAEEVISWDKLQGVLSDEPEDYSEDKVSEGTEKLVVGFINMLISEYPGMSPAAKKSLEYLLDAMPSIPAGEIEEALSMVWAEVHG